MRNKTKKKRSALARRVRRIFGTIYRLVMSVILVGIITGCICACALTVYILDYIGTIENIDITNIDANFTSIIYANDKEGEPYELSRIHGKENRIPVDYTDMPAYLIDVTVAAEDKRFWDHHGVDWKRTAAAAVNMFIPVFGGRAEGGSTITQQLIKNVTDQWAPNVERKVKEIFSALKLENEYTKQQILEAYLNVAAFGHNTNGIEAAANFYFNKQTKDLTLLECATIVATTQAPTGNDPIKNPDNNKARRQYIFKTMKEMGKISDKDYNEVFNADVKINLSQAPAQQPNSTNTWFVDHVIDEVIQDLQAETGKSASDASSLLFRGGLEIYTTVDAEMQEKLQNMYIYQESSEDNVFPALANRIYPESAFVVLDHHGQIKALAGSNRTKKGNRLLDYATDEPRQPGSTMKPISAYLQGIERDFITYSTVFADSPIQKPGTTLEKDGYQPWPVNYYAGYSGMNTCVRALQRSINTIPVKILNVIGPDVSLTFLHDKLGLSSLVTPEENPEVNDANLSAMALGGTTEGLTPLELAGAYQIHANGGYYTEPTSYTLVRDREGKNLLEADAVPRRVISKETSTIINRMMQMVVTTAPGTGTDARFTGDLAAMPIAGKTGTSSDNFDQWFVGITPYYIGVTWLGFAPKRQPVDYSGHKFPTPIIWRNVMQPLHEGLEISDFDYSENVVAKEYCTVSGDLAGVGCPGRLTGWYKSTNIPDVCMEHTGVQDSEETDEIEERDEEDDSDRVGRFNIRDRSSSSESSSRRSRGSSDD